MEEEQQQQQQAAAAAAHLATHAGEPSRPATVDAHKEAAMLLDHVLAGFLLVAVAVGKAQQVDGGLAVKAFAVEGEELQGRWASRRWSAKVRPGADCGGQGGGGSRSASRLGWQGGTRRRAAYMHI